MEAQVVSTPRQRLAARAQIMSELEAKLKANPDQLPVVLRDKHDPSGAFPRQLYFIDKNQAAPRDIFELPTRCTAQEIDAILSTFAPLRKSLLNLSRLASSYKQRGMPALEGGTSIGKTYAVNTAVKLMYGPKAKPLDFYCNGQTDTAELLAKYAPNANDPGAVKVQEFRHSETGKAWLAKMVKQGVLSAESPEERVIGEAAAHLGVVLRKDSFKLVMGALPKAAMGSVRADGVIEFDENHPGRGAILHVQEVGFAKSTVIAALLQTRGTNGEIADSFQLWEDSGRVVPIGPETFIVYSTNTLRYADRNPIDAALARGVDWERMGELDADDIKEAAGYYFRYRLGNKPDPLPESCIIDISTMPELCQVIGDAAAHFHALLAPKFDTGQAGGDRQRIPLTFDDLAKLSVYMLTSQVVNGGKVDLVETLVRGLETRYLNHFADPADRQRELTTLRQYLTDKNGPGVLKDFEFNGTTANRTIAEAITLLTDAALKEDEFSLAGASPEAKQVLERLRQEQATIDKIAEKFMQLTPEHRLKIIVSIRSQFSEEGRERVAAMLDGFAVDGKDAKAAKDWAVEKKKLLKELHAGS